MKYIQKMNAENQNGELFKASRLDILCNHNYGDEVGKDFFT